MPGAGAQNGKGGPKWPELCIKTVIRLCTGISQNHHPCLLTLPFRTGRYLLFRNVCRGPKHYSYATVLHTEVDAHCDKLTDVVGRTSTVASIVNLVRPTTVASLSRWVFTLVELYADNTCNDRRAAAISSMFCSEFGTKFHREIPLLWRSLDLPKTQCRTGLSKRLCQDSARHNRFAAKSSLKPPSLTPRLLVTTLVVQLNVLVATR